MYSLDINFLKDRPDYVANRRVARRSEKQSVPMETMLPLFLGVAVGIILPVAVGGLWFFLQQQIAGLEQQQAELEKQLGALKGIDEQVNKINQEVNQVNGETQALASVFNQIKPWSAMLQDIRERIPPGVRIRTIQQTQIAAASPSPSPGATPSPSATPSPNAQAPPAFTSQLTIAGTARSFNEVNDFLLTLQRSNLLKKDETQLVSAKLIDDPTPVEFPKVASTPGVTTASAAPEVKVQLPKVVDYTIQTNLNNVPASELLRELDRKGAVGLVTRIRSLQEKGVIQP